LDDPPLEAPFDTFTATMLVFVRSVYPIAAFNCVLLIKVVVRAELFHCTTESETKFDPLTINVIALLPAGMLEGDREEIAGGLVDPFEAVLVLVLGEEEPPPQPENKSPNIPMKPAANNGNSRFVRTHRPHAL
jgi:hypothetical protein